MTPKLSIVVPAYNEEQSLQLFYEETKKYVERMPVETEFLFVDDGSWDGTLEEIRKLSEIDKRVCYVSFSRNFGKEAAIYAGLENAHGDYIVIMDADLQDPPKLLPEMYRSLSEEEYDIVGSRRVSRKGEPAVRSFFARMFYKLIRKISNADIVDGARDFQMMTRQVADAVLSLSERNRFSKGIFGWVGYRRKWLEYENVERVAGETKWSLWKLMIYALDGIIAFSTTPLILSSLVGILFCLIALVMIFATIIRTILFGDPTAGWPSLVCIIMLVSGVQLFCLGILSQYFAKAYMETKNRPIYLAKEKRLGQYEVTSHL